MTTEPIETDDELAVTAPVGEHVPLAMTPCGPLCDQDHKVNEPHNRNRATAQPTDHATKANGRRIEAVGGLVTFEWDGEEWTFQAEDGDSLEFLAALEDADSGADPGGFIRAMRLLLGHKQAARLFKGRRTEAVIEFFTAASEAVGAGNRSRS